MNDFFLFFGKGGGGGGLGIFLLLFLISNNEYDKNKGSNLCNCDIFKFIQTSFSPTHKFLI